MASEPSTSEQRDGHLAPRRNADYFYDAVIGNFVYGEGHPMRPHRVRLVHHLVVNYGLYKHLNVFRPKAATKADMQRVFLVTFRQNVARLPMYRHRSLQENSFKIRVLQHFSKSTRLSS